MSPEIFALLAPLPAKVKAVTVTDDNITFTIVISEYLCERSREAALNHELNQCAGFLISSASRSASAIGMA